MSTLPPNKKVVNRHIINEDETLCTFNFVYNSDPNKQGMFAYPQENLKVIMNTTTIMEFVINPILKTHLQKICMITKK